MKVSSSPSKWNRSGTSINYTSGNVGIGTASPEEKLVVYGTHVRPVIGEETTNVDLYNGYNAQGWTSLDINSSRTTSGRGATLNLISRMASTEGLVISFVNTLIGTESTDDLRLCIIIADRDGANNTGKLSFWTMNTGTPAERMRITGVGNVKIAGTATRGTTEGTNHLDIFNGTAPVGTLTNGISLYSTAGELRVMDSAGNATLLSPHDKKTNEWIYDSVDSTTGKHLRVEMEKMVRFLNKKFGQDWIKEI
jgi:hypothetical protein